MPWIRVDDHFDEHPKFAAAGPLGMALWLAGLAYSNRNLTDGFIPWSAARTLVSWQFLRREEDRELVWTVGIGTGLHGQDVDCGMVAVMLVDAGLWEEVEGGYHIHDFEVYQPTKTEVLAERAKTAERVRRFRNGSSNRVRNAVTNTVSTASPVPVPVPSASNEALDAREVDDGRRDLEAWLLVKRHVPTQRQRAFLDVYQRVFDRTGPERAERLILSHPDDPIAALKDDLDAFRSERLEEAKVAEQKPSPPRRSGGMPESTKELLAYWAAEKVET